MPSSTATHKEAEDRRSLRALVHCALRTFRLVYRVAPGLTAFLAGVTVLGALIGPVMAYCGKRLVDGVVAGDWPEVRLWIGVELALMALRTAVNRGQGICRSIMGSQLTKDVNLLILERANRLDLRDFENAQFYDRLRRAREGASFRPLVMVMEGFISVQNVITVLGYSALLFSFSPWVVLAIVAASLPATRAEMKHARTIFRIRNYRSPEARRLVYLGQVLAQDNYAKEIRLFGLQGMLLARYREVATRLHDEDSRLALRRALAGFGFSLVPTLAFYGVYGYIGWLAATGALSLGNLTMYERAFRSSQAALTAMLAAIGIMYENNLYMSNLFAFLDYTERPAQGGPEMAEGAGAEDAGATASAPASGGAAEASMVLHHANGTGVKNGASTVSAAGEQGLRFAGVGFRYPEQPRWVFQDVNLFIPKGQSVAVVGHNGAGKSTLVKLLTGLYTPTSGRILLDGLPLQAYEQEELRARFSVVFQDYNRYQLSFRENVSIGSVPHMEDESRVQRAVTRGGAGPVLDRLEQGMDAQLGHFFDEGVELSGGQWQSVALARGFMREEADTLVLDEPSAALDADAEQRVFERFKELAAGRTTIIISHRFPTVRLADRILVLDGGRLTEDGTHDELLARGGTYARYFRQQAAGYS